MTLSVSSFHNYCLLNYLFHSNYFSFSDSSAFVCPLSTADTVWDTVADITAEAIMAVMEKAVMAMRGRIPCITAEKAMEAICPLMAKAMVMDIQWSQRLITD